MCALRVSRLLTRAQSAHRASGHLERSAAGVRGCRGFRAPTPVARVLRPGTGVSQKNVEVIIGRLATDETLRNRFIADPAGTLRVLIGGGLDLSLSEIEALLETPAESWAVIACRIHPRLQKITLKGVRHEP
jgi:hypothetical protein